MLIWSKHLFSENLNNSSFSINYFIFRCQIDMKTINRDTFNNLAIHLVELPLIKFKQPQQSLQYHFNIFLAILIEQLHDLHAA
jgi:hypothetical protein